MVDGMITYGNILKQKGGQRSDSRPYSTWVQRKDDRLCGQYTNINWKGVNIMDLQEAIQDIKGKALDVEIIERNVDEKIETLTDIRDRAENVARQLNRKADELESISKLMEEADEVIYNADDEGIGL